MNTEELLKEIEEIRLLDNPLSYSKNAEHYKNKNVIDSAYIVEQFSQYGYFAAACVKYILRRNHKGQYEQDVIKIMHTYKLARFFCGIGDFSLRSSQNLKTARMIFALIPSMIDRALISVLLCVLTGMKQTLIFEDSSGDTLKNAVIEVTPDNADFIVSTILQEEIKVRQNHLNKSETKNESSS